MAIVDCKVPGCHLIRVIPPLNNSYKVKGLCKKHLVCRSADVKNPPQLPKHSELEEFFSELDAA